MESTIGKYEGVIGLVVSKLSRGLPWQEKQDLYQEARLALYEAGDVPKGLAYKIVYNRLVDYLRRLPPKADNIDDPNVVHRIDKKLVHFPNCDIKLDSEKAIELLESLPYTDRTIIKATFGINSAGATDKQLAIIFGKSEFWVIRTRKKALLKLKRMMNVSR